MVTPRLASTVVLVRPNGAGGFEILLTRRPPQMRFLGGFYVFPGGTVHETDHSPAMLQRCRGLSGEAAQRILDHRHEPCTALGHWAAVARELFEEVGVLLCAHENGDDFKAVDPIARERVERARREIVEEDLDFAAFLVAENLFCDLTRLVYFDHWVTPAIYPMRFDTRFFIAVLPPGQEALPRSEEVTHALWIEPRDGLARMDRGDFPILPPTTTVLQRLSDLSTWKRLCAEFKLS